MNTRMNSGCNDKINYLKNVEMEIKEPYRNNYYKVMEVTLTVVKHAIA
jgi:hypothetical protein